MVLQEILQKQLGEGEKTYSIFSEAKISRYYTQIPKWMQGMPKQLILSKSYQKNIQKMSQSGKIAWGSEGRDGCVCKNSWSHSLKCRFLSSIFNNNFKKHSKQGGQQKHSWTWSDSKKHSLTRVTQRFTKLSHTFRKQSVSVVAEKETVLNLYKDINYLLWKNQQDLSRNKEPLSEKSYDPEAHKNVDQYVALNLKN